ncbi:MAG: ATP-dependent helicase RhlE [Candidatus Hydrogenedentota bacterium]
MESRNLNIGQRILPGYMTETIAPERATTTFSDYDIDPRCLRVLERQGITTPTPIQAQAIPVALTGRDLIATAQTGTGKTLGFVLPSLTRLAREPDVRNRMLILLPTRELCHQVETVVSDLAKALHLRSVTVYGGVGYGPQTDALKRGCDIIVATPGRLLDHMGRGNVRFNELEILVLDEADRMLDMGFLPDIKRIVGKLPQNRQTLMFSATFAPELQRLSRTMLNEPERIEVGLISTPVETVRQLIVPVRQEQKQAMLMQVLREEERHNTIIFFRTKSRTDRVGKMLKKEGFKATIIHGDLSQPVRQKALDGFRSNNYDILVATDVAARGLDIEKITHVINYDIPESADDYVHRVGRTARAGEDGDAITFVTPSESSALSNIEKAIGRNLPRKEYPGAPPLLQLWTAPVAKRVPVDGDNPEGPSTPPKRMLRRSVSRRR